MNAVEALYVVCLELGPMPQTKRTDNLDFNSIRLKEAVEVLRETIRPEDPSGPSKSGTDALVELCRTWHWDRNLIEGSTDKDQFAKLIQEAGELSDNICKGRDIRDDIGDMLVVLINIAERNNTTLEECLSLAWDDIKDRKGQMVDGVFVKEEDELPIEPNHFKDELVETYVSMQRDIESNGSPETS